MKIKKVKVFYCHPWGNHIQYKGALIQDPRPWEWGRETGLWEYSLRYFNTHIVGDKHCRVPIDGKTVKMFFIETL